MGHAWFVHVITECLVAILQKHTDLRSDDD